MDITIDFGTSSGKIGFFNEDRLEKVFRGVAIADLGSYVPENFDGNLIISSVREKAEFIRDHLAVRGNTYLMTHRLKMPIKINYKTPETLGTDRLAAIIGAWAEYPGKDLLVIDTGTCITYDLLKADGSYPGGSISPGMELRFKSLHNYTARLPLLSRQDSAELVGGTTEEAILSGVINGLKAEMREIIRMYQHKLPHLQLVICGGDSQYFGDALSLEADIRPNLVLFGLKKVLDYNEA